MVVTFVRAEPVARHTLTFWFDPDAPVHFLAGQYTQLYLPHAGADARGERRWFTLSSSPANPLLGITTRVDPARGSSFKRELQALRPGARVHLAEPLGDFVLPKNTAAPLVFVAAGIGITPVLSMMQWLNSTAEQRDITLFYAARRPDELTRAAFLERYPRSFIPIVSQPDAGWSGETGRLDAARILEQTGAGSGQLFYLSGPERMVETLARDFSALGLNPAQIVADYFHGYRTGQA